MRRRRTWAIGLAGCVLVGLAADFWAGSDGDYPEVVSQRSAVEQAADARAAAELANMAYDSGNPAWSPDGRTLVFDAAPSGGKSQLYLARADGTGSRRLSWTDANDFDPSWSPDGKWVVFVSNPRSSEERRSSSADGRLDELYVVSARGDKRRRLTRNQLDESSPAWSPDGETIAFGLSRSGDFNDGVDGIYLMRARGGRPRLLASGFAIEPYAGRAGLAWSPDSRRIVAPARPGDPELAIVSVATGRFHSIPSGGAEMPAWSPDGRWIAYVAANRTSCVPLLVDCDPATGAIMIARADGKNARVLAKLDVSDGRESPTWSPTGKAVAFASGGLLMVDLEGGRPYEPSPGA